MMTSAPNIAIVILAAGASKRMGKPKQLLKWGETTLIDHAIKTVSKVNTKDIIVVLGAHFELIKNDIKTSDLTILNHTNWQKGLGSSIAFAVEHLQNTKSNVDGVLITLCDQPLITADFLKSIISKYQLNKNQIITTSYENEKQGVPALFDKIYFNELMTLSDDYGAKYLLKKHQPYVETLTPPVENMDLDTNEDYTNLYQSNFNK